MIKVNVNRENRNKNQNHVNLRFIDGMNYITVHVVAILHVFDVY